MNYAEKHPHYVFYCELCRTCFTPDDVDLHFGGDGEVYAYCPGADLDNTCLGDEFGPIRMSSALHDEVCPGEEEAVESR